MLNDTIGKSLDEVSLTVSAAPAAAPAVSITEDAAGDVLLPYTLPHAEYMYGCVATSVGMILGYYDLYGYTVDGTTYYFSDLIPGTISVDSRGSDGGTIYDMKDPSVLANFIASTDYAARFYGTAPEAELPYTFVDGDPANGLNFSEWNCLADYLGTGQYWRDNGDLSTTHYSGTLAGISGSTATLTVDTLTMPIRYSDFKCGLEMYVESVGYALVGSSTGSYETRPASTPDRFTFSDFMAEIDAGRPVLISMRSDRSGHMVTAYGYNASTNEIIFDDTYESDCRMAWDGEYTYGGNVYTIDDAHTIVLDHTTGSTEPPEPATPDAVRTYRDAVLVSAANVMVGKTIAKGGAEDKMLVSSGGLASSTAVNSGGSMVVSSGGLASSTVVSLGRVDVFGGTMDTATLNGGTINVFPDGKVNSATVENGTLVVYTDGEANSTTVNGGYLIAWDGTANSTTVNSGGELAVREDGMANSTTVNSGGFLFVSSGGRINFTVVNSSGFADIDDGLAYDTTLRGGYMRVSGVLDWAAVDRSDMYVAAYATASKAFIDSGSTLLATAGGEVVEVTVDGVLDLSPTAIGGESRTLYFTGSASGVTVNSGGVIGVGAGGRAVDVTIGYGGSMSVDSRSAQLAGRQTYGGKVMIYGAAGRESGERLDVTLSIAQRTPYDSYIVNNLAYLGADTLTVEVGTNQYDGTYELTGGAAAFDGTVTVKTDTGSTLGTLTVGGSLTSGKYTYSLAVDGGRLNFTIGSAPAPVDDAVKTYRGTALVSAANVMVGKTVVAGGAEEQMHVSANGLASRTTLGGDGMMYVSYGGLADSTTVNNGYMNIDQGAASRTVVNAGGVVQLFAAALANDTVINSGGGMIFDPEEAEGAWANNTVINFGGGLSVDNNGRLMGVGLGSTTVNSGGTLKIGSIYDWDGVGDGSAVTISGDHIYGGDVTINGDVDAYNANITFAVDQRSTADAEIVSGLDGIWSDSFFITVKPDQAKGTYKLASGATSFDQTVTVRTAAGSTLGTLSVGGSLTSGDHTYGLVRSGELLNFTVADATAPVGDAVRTYQGDTLVSAANVMIGKTVVKGGAEDTMRVFSGGLASRTAVSSGAYMYVSNGGVASDTAVTAGHEIVSSGGVTFGTVLRSIEIAPNQLPNAAKQFVYNGGRTYDTVVGKHASCCVYSGGSTFGTVIESNGAVYFSSGAYAEGLVVEDGGGFKVDVVGGDTETFLSGTNAKGSFKLQNGVGSNLMIGGQWVKEQPIGTRPLAITVSGGGLVQETTVRDYSAVLASSGGIARNTSVEGGTISVLGGYAEHIEVHRGVMQVFSGVASDAVISSGGRANILGGVASDTVVNSGGSVTIFSGGTVRDMVADSGARLYASGGAIFSEDLTIGGYAHLYGAVDAADADVTFVVDRRSTTDIYLVNDLSRLDARSYSVTVKTDQAEGTYQLANGAASFDRTVTVRTDAGATLGTLSVGGSLTSGDYTYGLVRSGETLNFTVAGAAPTGDAVRTYQGTTLVSAAQVMTGKTIVYGGAEDTMRVFSGGVANQTVVSSGGSLSVSGGGVLNSGTVYSGGTMYVNSYSVANDVAVEPDGRLYINYLGSAHNVIVSAGGFIGGFSWSEDRHWDDIVNGRAQVAEQAWIIGNSLQVSSGGIMTGVSINTEAYYYVMSGGTANETTVNSGYFVLSSGGTANGAVFNRGGGRALIRGGTLNSAVVNSGGLVYIISGKITGRMEFADGAIVYASSGGIVDFDISEVAPGAAARCNNYTMIRNAAAATYTVSVSATQASGTYALADNAASFNNSVTVKTDTGSELGTLTVGGSLTSGDRTYSLALAGGTLNFTVAGSAPATNRLPGDLDGDGRADIIMSITEAGHGAEGATGAWLIDENQTPKWGDLSQRNPGWEIFGTGFTNSTKTTADVYVKSDANVIGAWVTDETGKVATWQTVGQFDENTQVLGLGDFNGDGQTDLLLRNTNGAVGCYFTSGDVTGWNYFQSLGDEWTVAAVGDLNGDGRDDVVLEHKWGFAGSWLTQDDYTMKWENLDMLDGAVIVGTGDFDGDGTSDVLLQKGSYFGAWVVDNGRADSWMGLGDLGDVTVEQIHDFDGDGKDDIRIRTAAGDLGAQLVKGADTLEWKYYGSVGQEWSTCLAAI